MHKFAVVLVLSIWSIQALGVDKVPEAVFLEWLGQVTEVEELGVDINELIERKESAAQSKEAEEKNND